MPVSPWVSARLNWARLGLPLRCRVSERPVSADRRKNEDLAAALTEQRNPRSENLEKLSARQLVELFVEEEKFVQEALRGAIDDLTKAIEIATGITPEGWTINLCRCRHKRPAGRARCE